MPPKTRKAATHAVRRTTAVAAPVSRTRAQARAAPTAAATAPGASATATSATPAAAGASRRPATRSSVGVTDAPDVTPHVLRSPMKATRVSINNNNMPLSPSARLNASPPPPGGSDAAAAKAAERFKRAHDHIASLVAAVPLGDGPVAAAEAQPSSSTTPAAAAADTWARLTPYKAHRTEDPLATPPPGSRGGKAVLGPSIPPPSPQPEITRHAVPDGGTRPTGPGLKLFSDEDVTLACALCRGLLVVVRTHLAQFRDVEGLLARRRGLVCDARVMSSAGAVVSHSYSPALIGHLGALFADTIAISWVRSASQLALVMPRVHMLHPEIASAADMEADLRQRHPGGIPAMQAVIDAVRIPSFVERAGSIAPGLGARASAGREASEAALRHAEAVPDVVIPADLDGFLSEGRAAAIRQSIAFKKFAREKHIVAKNAELTILDSVLPSYDRLRAHFVRGVNSIGTSRALELLSQLSCDARPVDPRTAKRRMILMCHFSDTGVRMRHGTMEDGVLGFHPDNACRTYLAEAVKAKGGHIEFLRD